MTWTNKVRDISFGLQLGRAERCADQEWLEVVNAERKSQQLDKVSYETFEIIMDRLEKEWFDLVRPLVLNAARSFANICPVQEHTQDRHGAAF